MRKARVVHPNRPHHIIHRGNNRRRLFSYARDYQYFLALLWAAVEKTECTVHALCLMANHVHLIATPASKTSLAEFVQFFAQAYARHRNMERSASGKLFEERYWSEPITTVFQLAVTTMYIDRNPVAAGVMTAPELYRWSSYRGHSGIGKSEKVISDLCTPTDWYLSLGHSKAVRNAEYQRLFELYSVTALARAQAQFYRKVEGGVTPYTRRLERPDRSSAREPTGFSRYGLKG